MVHRIARRLVSMTGPGLAIQELLYGFIMELIFVTAARIGMLGYDGKVDLILMILGMNATWGAIDAVIFYIVDSFDKTNHLRIINLGKESNGNREKAVEYLMDSFSGTALDTLTPEDERRICSMIIDCRTEDEEGLRRDKHSMMMSSLGCFVITILTIVPVALPILVFEDIHTGLAVASGLSAVIMFFVGYRMQNYYMVSGWMMGILLTAIGWTITIVATFTGG